MIVRQINYKLKSRPQAMWCKAEVTVKARLVAIIW